MRVAKTIASGRLEEWILVNDEYLMGKLFDDTKGRWEDGKVIRTTELVTPAEECKQGAVITTLNSTYVLGIPVRHIVA